jgi:membrane-bound ClpP family serine protease
MEDIKTKSGQNLGIAALITGIITFVLAVIPCVGVVAIIPGIITIVLSGVGLSQASRNNAPKGMMLAALIIGILAVMIAFSQFFVVGRVVKHSGKWPTEIQSIIDDAKDNVMKDLEDANVSIKIESNGDTVEIKANSNSNSNRKNLEQKLEDLESGNKVKNDTIKKVK